MAVQGEYTSVWDGGKEVISEVLVDLEDMRIVEWGERWLGGAADEYDAPDEFETIEEEYVYIPDTNMTYTAIKEEEADWTEDVYGNGIILY